MEQLYKEYSMLVYNYLNSLCGDCLLAEELTQETFYKAVKGINKFNNECKVSTWLCTIAKNTWLDLLRKEKKKANISLNDERYVENLVFGKSLEEELESNNEIIDLYKYIHKLDVDTREVFYLRIRGELSFKNIREILGKSENWARLAFYRGKIKLKEAMKNNERKM